jgi:hypothetical protein
VAHPLLNAQIERKTHHQIVNKAFEDRAYKALEEYLVQKFIVNNRVPDNNTR